jgi:uncharacterized protein YcsI (UPF0317 family)
VHPFAKEWTDSMLTTTTATSRSTMTPHDVRLACRDGRIDEPTTGFATDYAQANLVVLPHREAEDFLRFCQLNPQPCPLLDVTLPGSPEPAAAAPGADLRTDLPRYQVYRHGELVESRADVVDLWRDDFVGFLLGCSYTFEGPLIAAGVPVRHQAAGRNVPMYRTTRQCVPSGAFAGPLVVSCRSIPAAQVDLAVTVSGRYPAVHGAPVHIGKPAELGIAHFDQPDWGDPPVVEPGDVPVFWACGVTPQAVAMASRPNIMITHAAGYMFVTDLTVESLRTD